MTPTVYLAGPITGLSYAGSTDWRKYATDQLAEADIKGLSPMRAKEHLAHLKRISATGEEYSHLNIISTPRAVTTRDRWDATRCDVLLANLMGATQVSVGTVMEIAWADLSRIPVVCAIEETGNPHEHMMVNECLGFRVASLDAALSVVKALLR